MATIAKTVGSFDKVLATCKQIGAQYQPNVAALSPAALGRLHDRAQQSVRAATQAQIECTLAIRARQKAFADVPKLAVRIVRILSADTQQDVQFEAAKLIRNKFYSPRKENVSADAVEASPSTRATGRKSFDQQLDTFSKLVELIAVNESYNPAEPELTLIALRKKVALLSNHSQHVAEKQAAAQRARLERNELVFGKKGIIMTGRAVRSYVMGAFGSFSPQAMQINAALQL